MKIKLLFFIGTLRAGGKERRLVELLSYLKNSTDHELMMVLRNRQIDYPAFYDLNIPYELLTGRYKKKDIKLPLRFYEICKTFQPDIIHTWGNMPAFVSLPAVILKRIPHVNSQITSAPPFVNKSSLLKLIDRINFRFSDVIASNSDAGLKAFNPPQHKSMVIYNGIYLSRFADLPSIPQVKAKYNISTPRSVVMVGSFSQNKDFDLFTEIAELITAKRKDINFVCVGDGVNHQRIEKRVKDNSNIVLTGRINEVEAVINACDLGVLLSNQQVHGEGISNTILEYMALKKPVIANDAGGTKEIIDHGVNGYLVTDESAEEIAEMMEELIDNPEKRKSMGMAGRQLIEEQFAIDKMGVAFMEVYKKVLKQEFQR